VTAWQLVVGLFVALGGVALAAAKADLEDEAVYRWLACKLIDRAARHLPDDERDRWREESISDVLDLPGRFPPLIWALDVYRRSGRWGRMRGAPSRWQVLLARLRTAWQRLRSLPQARARALSKQRHPAFQAQAQVVQAQAEVAQAIGIAADATVIPGPIARSRSRNLPFRYYRYGKYWNGLPHLSHEQFVAWLAEQRQGFESDIDRQVEEWKQRQWRQLGRG
jgi:hypothetical protein